VTGHQIHKELIKAAEAPYEMGKTIERIIASEGYSHSWATLRDEKARLKEFVHTAERRMYKEVDGDMTFSAKEIDNQIRYFTRNLHEIQEGSRILAAHNIVVTAAKQELANAGVETLNKLQSIKNKKFVYVYTKEEK